MFMIGQTSTIRFANLYSRCVSGMARPIKGRTAANFMVTRRSSESLKKDIWRGQGPTAAIGNRDLPPTRENTSPQPPTRISRNQPLLSHMSDEELREINGIKPNVWLEDGAEREVSSQSRCETKANCSLEVLTFILQ